MIPWKRSGIVLLGIYFYSPTFGASSASFSATTAIRLTRTAIRPFKELRRCLSSESKIETCWNCSVETCGKKCGAKQNCLSFNYLIRGKICMLLAKDTLAVEEGKPKGPCLHFLRSDIHSEHICDEENGGCGVTGCPLPAVTNADVYGNILTVGSRIKVECHSEYTKMFGSLPARCGEDGTWTNIPQCSATVDPDASTLFTFGFLKKGGDNRRSVFVVSPSPDNVVVLTLPLMDFRREVTVTNAAEITIPYELYVPDSTGNFSYGFHLESTAPVGVYASNGLTGSSDGTVVFPEEHLSTEYVLLSWSEMASYKEEFTVVGTIDNTVVQVTFPHGSPLTLTLNKYQIYSYQTTDELSGTFVTSTENIAVYAGHECANVMVRWCDHLYEQMPPISHLQREYVISYPYPRFKYVLRIIAVEDDTEITLSNGISRQLDRGEYSQEELNNEPIAISANNKIMVAAYSLGREGRPDEYPETFDGSLLILPGLSQFKEWYTMLIPSNVVKCVLMVTYPSYVSSTNNIRLNEMRLAAAASVNVTVIGRGMYTVLYAELSTGTSVIYTTDGTAFGAFLSFFRYKSEAWFSLPYKF